MQSQTSAPARRTKVNGRRGIYYREGASGRRRYEITYLDSEGTRRWRVVSGGLKEADAALEEVRTRMRRGERVAPTRQTFAELADLWLASQSELRPNTLASYEGQLRVHIKPRFGRMRIADITEDHVALLIADLRARGYTGWSIRATLTPLGRVLGYAARRGYIASNPVARLERGERPSVGRADMRILSRDEIGQLLVAAGDEHRALVATAVFTGLRLGELLGLTWANVDLDVGVVRVRRQLDRRGVRVEPKTPQAIRDVVLMPALARVLAEHRLRSRFSDESDYVFASGLGRGLDHSVPRRALKRALKSARLVSGDAAELRWHDLRHTFASLLIAQGANVVFVSRQLGHATPATTLKEYAHLFDGMEHAQRASAALEASFGNLVETSAGNGAQSAPEAEHANVAVLGG